MNTRRKPGLRRAQRTYQGSAVAQNAAMAIGWARRKASRHRPVKNAHRPEPPPAKTIAAGPLASVAAPRKTPNATSAAMGVRGGDDPAGSTLPATIAAATIAMVSIPLNGMSGAAAWEKPIMPTVVGSISNTRPAVSALYIRQASHARARVANNALTAEGKRADASLTPKNLNERAAPQ